MCPQCNGTPYIGVSQCKLQLLLQSNILIIPSASAVFTLRRTILRSTRLTSSAKQRALFRCTLSPRVSGTKLSAIRQFAPNTIMPELHSIFTKTSEKSNRLTYYNCTTNLYITNNTAYWAKSLRESGIRTDSRISQLISLALISTVMRRCPSLLQ